MNAGNLLEYWTGQVGTANLLVVANLLGALCLGLLVGYERTYRGRAAGMRTYGLVCMASAAVIVVAGYPAQWYGGHVVGQSASDVSHVIQGVLTGIGFLCAGVIMRDGFTITGLTTAASIWVVATIGIVVGVGFYLAAITLAGLAMFCMMAITQLETRLPARQSVSVQLHFVPGVCPSEHLVHETLERCGYELNPGSIAIDMKDHRIEWRFVATAFDRHSGLSVAKVARVLENFPGVESWHLAPARN